MLFRTVLAIVLSLCCAPAQAQDTSLSFDAFKAALWPDAQAKGVTRTTFDLALKGVTPNPRVIAATKRQPEYGKPVGAYVNGLASRSRIANGQSKAKDWAKTFDAVEKKFGVERWVLIALWGVESDYGAEKDRWDVFRSLATLAYARYRHPYFRDELIVAMRIMQDGHYARDRMVSSWAGAMGQSQFMPSNIDAYAVAFSGRGHPDLWNNVPDVLASTANYLAKEHWQRGLPWGFEVVVPQGFNYRQSRGTFAQWNERGVRRADGKPFPQDGNGILFFPSGAAGPAFIATDNYSVLKEYNDSDAYVIAVGHLADRINGGQPIQAKWPTNDRPISRDARIGLQKKLAALGYSVNEFEGHIDFDLRDNIRDEQIKLGMVPDGDPTVEFVRRLGVEVR
jgi:lytic murein transglycosylase